MLQTCSGTQECPLGYGQVPWQRRETELYEISTSHEIFDLKMKYVTSVCNSLVKAILHGPPPTPKEAGI